jgi:hypothetical protein
MLPGKYPAGKQQELEVCFSFPWKVSKHSLILHIDFADMTQSSRAGAELIGGNIRNV